MIDLHERFGAMPAPSPADRLTLRDGSMKDYAALAEFHYLRNKPVTATRVIVMEDPAEPVAGRFGHLVNPKSATPGIRNPQSSRVVGVLVESYPALSCALRDAATDNRYAGWRDRRAAAKLINAEVRCISRVVVHPQWRGLGLAVTLVRRALATATTPITEALAAMGRVHPFFELAGMTAYRRWPHAKDQRLIDVLRYAGVEPWELASAERVRGWIDACAVLRRELRRWAGGQTTLDEQIAMAREKLLAEPVYYITAKQESGKTGKQEMPKAKRRAPC